MNQRGRNPPRTNPFREQLSVLPAPPTIVSPAEMVYSCAMNPSGPSSSVVAAGVIGILVSLVTILLSVVGVVGMSMLPPASAGPPMPPFVKSTAIAIMIFTAGLAIFGIFTSVGVLHLKNWARISMLIWGGVMAAFCGLALPFAVFVPMPQTPAESPMALPFVRLLLIVVYGIPFLIGVWWLLLFNQRAVKEEFLRVAPGDGQLAAPARPRCPLPLAILAGFSIVSAGFSLLLPFTNFPVNTILFGHRFHGAIGVVLFYLSAGLLLVGAIGMLRLKRWSYPLMLGQYFFWMASGTITLVSPNYDSNVHEIMSQMNLPEGPVGQAAFAQTRVFGILSLIPGVLLIWLLLYCHTRFVEACAAKEARQST